MDGMGPFENKQNKTTQYGWYTPREPKLFQICRPNTRREMLYGSE